MPASVTLADVAEHSGVSLATASRVLNGSTRVVNAELRDRVRQSAVALGYSTNAQAQAVAKGTSNTVAVVVGDIADPYFSSIVSGVVEVAERRGLIVTISTAGFDEHRGYATVRALKGQRPRALILAASRRRDDRTHDSLTAELAAVEKLGGRICVIGSAETLRGPAADEPRGAATAGPEERSAAPPSADAVSRFRTVLIRNREGARDLAVVLQERGYRDFCILAGDPDLVTPSERASGFADAAREAGCPIAASRIVTGSFSRDGAVAALRGVLATGDRPDCVFAVTDVMAVGAMAALREFGLVPGVDVGVAGFDDIETLQDVIPSLTTVALPLTEIGARALELALEDPGDAPGSRGAPSVDPVEGRVILRDSTPDRLQARSPAARPPWAGRPHDLRA